MQKEMIKGYTQIKERHDNLIMNGSQNKHQAQFEPTFRSPEALVVHDRLHSILILLPRHGQIRTVRTLLHHRVLEGPKAFDVPTRCAAGPPCPGPGPRPWIQTPIAYIPLPAYDRAHIYSLNVTRNALCQATTFVKLNSTVPTPDPLLFLRPPDQRPVA